LTLPIVTNKLSSLFAVGGPSGRLDTFSLPAVPQPAASLSDLAHQLDAVPGVEILATDNGIGGYPAAGAGDLLLAQYTTTLDLDTLADQFNDDVPEQLKLLAKNLNLDGEIALHGMMTIVIGFGLDHV